MAEENKVLIELEFKGSEKTAIQLERVEEMLKAVNKEMKKSGEPTRHMTMQQKKLQEAKKNLNADIRKNIQQFKAENTSIKGLGNSYNDLVKKNQILVKRYKALDPAIAGNTKKMKNLSRQINSNSDALKKMDGTMGRSFRNVGNYKSAITGLAGAFIGTTGVAGLAMLIKGAVETLADFEMTMAKVKAISGATEKDFKKLTQSAKDLGGSTIFTASQVAQLQLEFSKLGFSTGEILAASEATLDLAVATGSDLAEAAIVAASTVRGFGLEAQETQRVTDVMAKSITSSALDVGKFSTAMATVAPVAKNAGATLEETTAILAKVTDAGVEASTAGTGLRNIFLRLAKKGITFAQAMAQIQVSSNKNATAMELFGVKSATVATIIAGNTTGINELTASFENSAGAAKEMADVVGETLTNKIKILQSTLQGILLDEGTGFNEFLKDSVDAITVAAKHIGNLGTITELTLKGVGGASEEARIELLKFGQVGDLAFKEWSIDNIKKGGQSLTKLLTPLNEMTSTKFLSDLKASKDLFISLFVEQGRKMKDILPLWDTYRRLRLDQVKEEARTGRESKKTTENLEEQGESVLKLNQQYKDFVNTQLEQLPALGASLEENMNKKLQDITEKTEKLRKEAEGIIDLPNGGQITKDELERADEIEQQKQDIAKQGQEALFGIVSNGVTNRANEEIRVLQEKQKAGLISEQAFEEQSTAIKKAAFRKQKALSVAEIATNLALELSAMAKAAGGNPFNAITAGGAGVAQYATLATLAVARAGLNTALVLSQKFAKGGLVEGGMFEGKSHADGGVKFSSGGRIMEAEGGEAIINKRSTAMFKPMLSAMNAAGGGKKFALGGITPDAQLMSGALSEAGIGAEMARQLNKIKVINVVSETTAQQNSITNVESEAIF